MRIILTFESTHAVLAAEKALKANNQRTFHVRPTPTPPGLSESVCGMSLEILSHDQKQDILSLLASCGNKPQAVVDLAG
ncbi:MAG: DUF3343 domain-containing protein [Candidatus Obscuribacterales bacterium]|nr:DUF3343 domain-containing protein [Candidatus Obscuribacterales bacterium]